MRRPGRRSHAHEQLHLNLLANTAAARSIITVTSLLPLLSFSSLSTSELLELVVSSMSTNSGNDPNELSINSGIGSNQLVA